MKWIEWALLVGVWTIILLLLLAMFQSSDGHAVSQRTRSACTGSYLSLCSHTTPGTQQCRACFRFNWKRLDASCKAAIRVDPAYKSNFKKR